MKAGETSTAEDSKRLRAVSTSDCTWLYGYESGVINGQSR